MGLNVHSGKGVFLWQAMFLWRMFFIPQCDYIFRDLSLRHAHFCIILLHILFLESLHSARVATSWLTLLDRLVIINKSRLKLLFSWLPSSPRGLLALARSNSCALTLRSIAFSNPCHSGYCAQDAEIFVVMWKSRSLHFSPFDRGFCDNFQNGSYIYVSFSLEVASLGLEIASFSSEEDRGPSVQNAASETRVNHKIQNQKRTFHKALDYWTKIGEILPALW